MANTKALYEGDGTTSVYSIPFPYISRNHVVVSVNSAVLSTPSQYVFLTESTVQLTTPPIAGAAVEIKRDSSPNSKLVNYQSGAVLTEPELDLDSEQAFYLIQEVKENYSDLIESALIGIADANGLVVTDPTEVTSQLVQDILNNALTTELQSRILDIDLISQTVLQTLDLVNTEYQVRATADDVLQTQLSALVGATVATVYTQAEEPVPGAGGIPDPIPVGSRWYDTDDGNHPYLWDDVGLVWLDLRDPQIGNNQAAITALDARLTTGEAGIAANGSAITVLDSTVTAINSQVTSNSSRITDLESTVDDPSTGVTATSTALSALGTRVTAAEGLVAANASDVTALTATVNGNTAAVTSVSSAVSVLQGDVVTLEARYGVSLNSNGYITGFEQFNDGTTGTFQIMADQFYIVDPAGDGQNPRIPFAIVDGVVAMQNVVIGGALIEDLTVGTEKIADNAVTLTAKGSSGGFLGTQHTVGSTVQVADFTMVGGADFNGRDVILQMSVEARVINSGNGAVFASLYRVVGGSETLIWIGLDHVTPTGSTQVRTAGSFTKVDTITHNGPVIYRLKVTGNGTNTGDGTPVFQTHECTLVGTILKK